VNVESRRAAVPPVVLAATLALAAGCWAAAAALMGGMDMGVATRPGSFGFFAAAWVTMMAAMMLPGAAPAVARRARIIGTVMAMLVALDVMSLFWMSVVAVLASAQKLLPAKAAIDVPLALAIVGLGFVIVFVPSLVPGLTPPAM